MEQSMQKTIKGAVGVMTLLIMLVAVFMVIKIFKEVNVVDANEGDTITVSGDSEIFAKPDIASVTFSVRTEDVDLIKAQADAEAKIAVAIKSIKDSGVDEKDIQTTYYNASPRYEWDQKCGQYGCDSGERKLYEVNESVSVKVRDLTKASSIIGLLGSAKVTDIQGPNFDIEDRDALMEDARKEAIKEAKDKAQVLAKELGVNLGKIIAFNDGGNGGYPMPMYAKAEMDMAMNESSAGASVAPTLAEGQNRIYSSVSITYKIK